MFKLVAFEDYLERENGRPCLFALVRLQGFMKRWDVYVSAPWVESDPYAARRYIVAELVDWLEPDERLQLGDVVALPPCDDFVWAMLERVKGHEPVHELRATVIEDVDIKRAVIINSCCAA